MRFWLILFAHLTSLSFSFSQRRTIGGYVRDAESNENLIGATIMIKGTTHGTTTNAHGYFSITSNSDTLSLHASYVGYHSKVVELALLRDTVVQLHLQAAPLLQEVVVTETRDEALHELTTMGNITVPVSEIKSLPALLGEVDVLKVIQLMPGVKSSEGATGFYVRGGGPDQNLILLDGVPVYNAAHLFGFFSVFNADAINHVELVKGGFPARYGGRLSSVLDIHMKDGNMNKFKAESAISAISAKATVEGPIKESKSSFIVSTRRTYVDLLAKPLLKRAFDGNSGTYFFYDINAKLNYMINQRNRVYFSAYRGNDIAASKDRNVSNDTLPGALSTSTVIMRETRTAYSLSWGNTIAAFRWNTILGPRLFGNMVATYSRYDFRVFNSYSERARPEPPNYLGDLFFEEENASHIRDWGARMDFDFVPSINHYFRFGGTATWHTFTPGVYRYSNGLPGFVRPPETAPIDGLEFSSYIEDEARCAGRFNLNAGVHVSGLFVEDHLYKSIQPRVSGRYLLQPTLAMKASFATMTQYIHLLTNAGLGLPTDLWVPTTPNVRPQQAWQATVGAAKTINKYEFSIETYYKSMSNLIEYRDGASYADRESDWQKKVVKDGKGRSLGAELLLQKKIGRLTGWAGYTLSWTNRTFPELNGGRAYPYKYDRRHDASIALTRKWSDHIDFSMAWVYGSGNHISLPTAEYGFGYTNYPGGYARYYPSRNNFQMRAYHRLDASISFIKSKKLGQRKWTIGAYNAYNHRNPFYLVRTSDRNGVPRFQEKRLFPIIPAITYSFKIL